ncbi:MAG: hypothetical protein V1936_02595 [Patescibacteria group bacterium]
MLKKAFLFVLSLSVFFLAETALAWTELGGGDHGGQDWSPANGAAVSGDHYNIGNFSVGAGVTIRVNPFDGSKYGGLTIQAKSISVLGVIDAKGSGYSGGNGGSGAPGVYEGYPQTHGVGGVKGAGPYSGAGGAGGLSGPNNSIRTNGYPGSSGYLGGYLANGLNGDSTTDENIVMGSGGGGGGGGGAGGSDCDCKGCITGSSGGGGGAGNPGGGYVKLIAAKTLNISGSILATGKISSSGNGGVGSGGGCGGIVGTGGSGGLSSAAGTSVYGSGGSSGVWCNRGNVGGGTCNDAYGSTSYGAAGGSGAAGAGGGVLLKAGGAISVSGTIDNRGGGNVTTNAGTLKIFYCKDPNYSGVKNYLGRYFAQKRNDCYQDIGLRLFDGQKIVKIAADPFEAVSPVRIFRDGVVYGLALVDVDDPDATKIKVQTSAGVKALRAYY